MNETELCPVCKAPNESGSNFCVACGTRLRNNDEPKVTYWSTAASGRSEKQPSPEAGAETAPETAPEITPEAGAETAGGGNDGRKKSPLRFIIPAIVALAAIAIVIYFAFARPTAEESAEPEYLLTSSKTYDENGELSYEKKFFYDEKGQEILSYRRFSNGVMIESTSYDESGNVTSEATYMMAGLVDINPEPLSNFEYKNEYDENGRLSSTECTTEYHKYKAEISYEYDSEDNVLKRSYTSSDGDSSVINYEYDRKGNVLKRSYTSSDGDSSVIDYEYDSKGNLLKETETNEDGETTVTSYEYEGDVLIGYRVYENDKLTYSYAHENNEFGCPVRTTYTRYDETSGEPIEKEYIEKEWAAFDESSGIVDYPGKLEYNGHHYLLLSGFPTWEDAKAYCESMGGYPAVISSQEENDAIYDYIESCNTDREAIAYFGYINSADGVTPDGAWHWVDGEESQFVNFSEGTRTDDDSAVAQACMLAAKGFEAGKWYGYPYLVGADVICELPY